MQYRDSFSEKEIIIHFFTPYKVALFQPKSVLPEYKFDAVSFARY